MYNVDTSFAIVCTPATTNALASFPGSTPQLLRLKAGGWSLGTRLPMHCMASLYLQHNYGIFSCNTSCRVYS